ncbi:uncharacterized protein [Triticum aestivum]|uniref:uncharacterized protein n=1 Tax=Triticum aestivum TaxID=4565 RepID=UPI001D02B51D|nr:uncharacterized protein LOC123039357 [Triticum aestivum]
MGFDIDNTLLLMKCDKEDMLKSMMLLLMDMSLRRAAVSTREERPGGLEICCCEAPRRAREERRRRLRRAAARTELLTPPQIEEDRRPDRAPSSRRPPLPDSGALAPSRCLAPHHPPVDTNRTHTAAAGVGRLGCPVSHLDCSSLAAYTVTSGFFSATLGSTLHFLIEGYFPHKLQSEEPDFIAHAHMCFHQAAFCGVDASPIEVHASSGWWIKQPREIPVHGDVGVSLHLHLMHHTAGSSVIIVRVMSNIIVQVRLQLSCPSRTLVS